MEIVGLADLRRALRVMEPTLLKGVRVALKDSAQYASNLVRRRAEVRSGQMRSSVRAFASGNVAGVRVNARRVSPAYPAGFPYPRIQEFRVRPFVRPAITEAAPRIRERMTYVLDDVAEAWTGA